jgi:hypothetical protein
LTSYHRKIKRYFKENEKNNNANMKESVRNNYKIKELYLRYYWQREVKISEWLSIVSQF